MPAYLVQLSLKPETLAGMMKKPADRRDIVHKLVQQVGGKLVGYWYSFGEYDVVVIVDGPESVGAAAFAIAVSASGAFNSFKTTPLLTVEEGMAAMKKGAGLKYKPPGS